MANEFKHLSVGGEITQAEYEAVGGHVLESQAIGDIIYATSTSQLSRLGIGATNTVLVTIGGVPSWATTLAGLTFTSPVLNTGVSGTAISTDTSLGTSNTLLSSQGAIKSYVDAVATASDLDFQGDSGGALSIDLDSATLDIAGGTGIDTVGGTNTLTVNIDSTVTTLTGSQTLTNKTLTAPTLTTPALGTPASGVATNLTGTAASLTAGNVTTNANLTGHIVSSGNATTLGTSSFTSAHLAGALTNETGTGVAVFNTSPTLVTPALGTPASGVATNLSGTAASLTAGNVTTNANLTGHVTSTGNAALLGAFTKAQLSAAVSDGTVLFSGDVGATYTDAEAITAVQNEGTLDLGGAVTIAGNLTVNGTTTTIDTATLSVEDPLIALATGNDGADTFDIGFYGLYDTSGSQDLYAGLFRDANDSGKWKLFKDNQAAPSATAVNTSGTGYAVGTLVATLEGNVTGDLTGNADTVTTNANLTGMVTSSGNTASLGAFTKAELSAAVSDGTVLYSGDAASAGFVTAMAIAL